MARDQTVHRRNDSDPFETMFTALADQRRRYVLYYLQEEERSSLVTVAEQIAAWERGCTADAISQDMRVDVEIALQHQHLPVLQEGGMIEYDAHSKIVKVRELPNLVKKCLDHCAPRELPEPPTLGYE